MPLPLTMSIIVLPRITATPFGRQPRLLLRDRDGVYGRDLAVINLTPAFHAAAARDLAHGAYIYWRDDSH